MSCDLSCAQLLDKSPTTRLGANFDEVRGHMFFRGVNWTQLESGQAVPPFKLNVRMCGLFEGRAVYIHVHISVCMYVCVHVCVCTCICVHVCVHVCVQGGGV